MIDVVAMSVAAKALGFPGTAALIERDQLSPARVASLFAVAASDRATKEGAVIVLCEPLPYRRTHAVKGDTSACPQL